LDNSNEYDFTFLPLEDITTLSHQWLLIEQQSNCHFFLSWTWIRTWIETYRPNLKILRAYYKGEIVAVAGFVFMTEWRYHFLRSCTLHVHQTGVPDKDQIWIEYNGILAKKGHENAVIKASINFLINISDTWDELVVGAITDDQASLIERSGKLMRHDLWGAPCYGVDLKMIRDSNKDYLTTLSRNTRYQIKRSIRKYQTLGCITIESSNSKINALNNFSKIAPLHIERWGYGVNKSGFTNPHFLSFHHNLIKNAWDKGCIDIVNVLINERSIASFYNYLYRNRVYFYLSGLVEEQDAKLKPGLTGHALCIQKYMDNGYDYYDFMGGGERYKSSLAVQHHYLVKTRLQKKKIKFKIEKLGRSMKKIFMNKAAI
jgi:hypothetical protein